MCERAFLNCPCCREPTFDPAGASKEMNETDSGWPGNERRKHFPAASSEVPSLAPSWNWLKSF